MKLKVLYKNLILALQGRNEWIRIKKKCDLKEGTLILFLTDNNEKINYYALKNLEDYRNKKYMDYVYVLTNQKGVKDLHKKMNLNYSEVIWIDNEKCGKVEKYYQLQLFFDHFLMVSVSQPKGNTVYRMLKSGKITEEELLLDSIYV